MIAVAGILAIAALMRSFTRPDTQEISFQHFKTQLLAKDVVDRIEVANKTTAKVLSLLTYQPSSSRSDLASCPDLPTQLSVQPHQHASSMYGTCSHLVGCTMLHSTSSDHLGDSIMIHHPCCLANSSHKLSQSCSPTLI